MNSKRMTQVRDALIDALRRELVGPDPGQPAMQWHGPGSPLNGEEILRPQDRPRMRYGAGILFPNGMTYSGLLDRVSDLPEVAGEEASTDETPNVETPGDEPDDDDDVPVLNSFVPSSMGLSLLVDSKGGLTVDVSWACYSAQLVANTSRDPAAKGEEYWFRTPHSESVLIDACVSEQVKQRSMALAGGAGPTLVVVDRPWSGGLRLITVTLINEKTARTIEDEDCFFQCGFVVRPLPGSSIQPYPERADAKLDAEERSLKLLYRHLPAYAVGHGCAADWNSSQAAVTHVRTQTLPTYEQPPVLPRNELPGVNLSMLRLFEAPHEELVASCGRLAEAYEKWIAERRLEAARSGLSAELLKTSGDHLDRCEESLKRIRNGIEILNTNDDAMAAFRWMNRAMVQQRSHYSLSSVKEKRRGWVETASGSAPERTFTVPDYPHAVAWRPFQLAFILMNLRSTVDPTSSERDLVDVIWFPTGGGKTEAYLGLAAWVMLYRRLKNPRSRGTTVLMRYTLRLLTAQQFQRASSLICALELLRRKIPAELGDEAFTIGLWLGSGVTPNTDQDAVQKLAELDRGDGPNPFVVLSCPWCGIDLGRRTVGSTTRVFGYERRSDPRATVQFRCPDPNCPFHDDNGLPLEVVDDRIYRRPPSVVIGTVDKFAMLPWNPEARKLFGIDYSGIPPELIIQDELHLISGPLGSMVGHYETLIEELCSVAVGGRRTGPKIIASTATISRADEQVEALYGRQARLFPAQALKAGDSFFAEERTDVPGRTYVGVCGSGLSSHVVAQIRTIAALLQTPATAAGSYAPEEIDPYWSLVAYFNSLRELGRASTLIQADIREYLNWTWARSGISDTAKTDQDRRRFINNDVELTSRVPSSDIPEILERLFTGHPDRDAIDVCFATNMIQVGLDVPRLSLMMIVGQPKGASEYIQASSRVGRDLSKPGLVVTNYNPFKPRDRSHFETFRQYHESIYRHVEPTSVTPFSLPVCDRAVHALAIGLIRCLEPSMREQPGTGPSEAIQKRVREVIRRRLDRVAPSEVQRAEIVLSRFFTDWLNKRPERYGGFSPDQARPLMTPAGRVWGDKDDPIPKPTPSSMRNVDAESEARLLSDYAEGGL